MHESWKHFIPKGEKEDFFDDNFLKNYTDRIRNEVTDIPENVLEQSFYRLHNNSDFVAEFGDINYYKVKFELVEWTTEKIKLIQPTYFSGDYIENRKKALDHVNGDIRKSSYGHLEDLIKFWLENGTWRNPIIVLNSTEFDYIRLKKPYHLFEGHNRLSWILYFSENESSFKLASKHKLWLISKK